MTAKRLVFDVETDGLLHELTRIHCLCIEDVDSGETYRYRNNIAEDNIEEGIDQLANADLIIGHNIINFDLPALDKVYPGTASRLSSVGIYDTQVSAAVVYAHRKELDYKLRPKSLPQNLYGSQALEAWGYRLGCEKGTFGKSTDWQEWSDAMEEYCAQDVTVNVLLFVYLIQREYSQQCIDLEHAFATIMQRQMENGVGFDSTGGETLYVEVESQRLSLEAELQKTIPGKVITGKTPQYWSAYWPSEPGNTFQDATKKQTLDLARPHRPKTDRVGDLVFNSGPLKEKRIPFNPSSTKQIGEYLIRQYGWEPTEFTDGGEPKVTEAVLSRLGYPEVPKLRMYLMLKKRISQISSGQEGWLKHDKDGIIYGRIKTNATITGRCSHASPNLAQVPAVKHNKIGDVLRGIEGGYGYECRALFHPTRKGWVMVGADASGLELRCLAHYLSKWDGGEYADQILNGDIHTYNQKAAGLPTRDNAKTFIYGWLYGAGAEKLGEIVHGGYREGKRLQDKFLRALPAVHHLKEAVSDTLQRRGWLCGLDGRHLYIRSEHSALNTLLQSAGAVIMKQAAILAYQNITNTADKFEHGKDFALMLNVHDELQLEVKDLTTAKVVGEALVKSFKQAGEVLQLQCPLDGDFKIGPTWAETH